MSAVVIIIGVIVCSLAFIAFIRLGNFLIGRIMDFIEQQKKNKAPFYRIKRKLEEDLSQANFSGDWNQRQQVNLEVLWLNTYFKVKTEVESKYLKDYEKVEMALKFSENEIRFLLRWDLEDFYHFALAEEIIGAYSKSHMDSPYKSMLRPLNVLPLPRDYIKKAALFIPDFMKYQTNNNLSLKQLSQYDNLVGMMIHMDTVYVNTRNEDLPMNDRIENITKARQFRNLKSDVSKNDESKLIDWL